MQKQISRAAQYAVVAGIDLNGLGVIRALASAGVPVLALDHDLDKPQAATRYAVKLKVRSLSGEAFIQDLLKLRERFGPDPVLFLTQEASVGSVSEHRARLAPHYRFTLPPHHVVLDLLDKIRFQTIADRHGFLVPKAVNIASPQDLEALASLRFPCVFKPATKDPDYSRRFAKAYKIEAADEAIRLWHKVRRSVGRVILQEWIEGDDSDVYFCLQYRNATAAVVSFFGRKICQWPPLVGGTASCIPGSGSAAEIEQLTDRYFSAAGFAGLGSMEFKRDRRDGKFYMIEPTVGRTDFQEEVATLNGVNIPLAAYLSEIGLSVPPNRKVDPPRAWRDPVGYARARDSGAPDPMRELLPRVKVCDAYWRAYDPMPYVALKFVGIRRRLNRLTRASGPTRSPHVVGSE